MPSVAEDVLDILIFNPVLRRIVVIIRLTTSAAVSAGRLRILGLCLSAVILAVRQGRTLVRRLFLLRSRGSVVILMIVRLGFRVMLVLMLLILVVAALYIYIYIYIYIYFFFFFWGGGQQRGRRCERRQKQSRKKEKKLQSQRSKHNNGGHEGDERREFGNAADEPDAGSAAGTRTAAADNHNDAEELAGAEVAAADCSSPREEQQGACTAAAAVDVVDCTGQDPRNKRGPAAEPGEQAPGLHNGHVEVGAAGCAEANAGDDAGCCSTDGNYNYYSCGLLLCRNAAGDAVGRRGPQADHKGASARWKLACFHETSSPNTCRFHSHHHTCFQLWA